MTDPDFLRSSELLEPSTSGHASVQSESGRG